MVIKVFVGNLPENATTDALRDLFTPYGNISDIYIIKNFAFVSFTNREDADNAVRDLHQTKMLGHTLIVEISKSQGRGGPGKQDRNDQNRNDYRKDGPKRSAQDRRGPPRNSVNPLVGGILGASPLEQPNPLGPLGIFSAVNTLAAVENQVRSTDLLMDNNLDNNSRDNYQSERTPKRNSAAMSSDSERRRDLGYGSQDDRERRSTSEGYVIYERYYVDPSHPLLKGLPLPKLSRVTDSYVAPRETEVRSEYNTGYGEYRPRSPVPMREREILGRDYGRVDMYDRR